MKKSVILLGTAILVCFSVIFYYDNVELPSDTEIVKENTVLVSNNKKEKNKSDVKNEVDKKEDVIEEKDLSICNENGKIMVLMYHKFAEVSKDGWTRSFSDFKNDLKLLYEKNYYPINLSDYISGNIDVPYGKTPVVLTFDDGLSSQLSFEWIEDELSVKENTAVKIYQDFVKEHPDFPMRGTFYIMSTNFFGAKGTLKQRLEFLLSLGFEIGNQTQNHYALQKATSAEKVKEEVGGLAKFVNELVPGYVINSFSPPGGSMTKKYEEYVYKGEYKGFSYENKGIVLLYGSKPTLSPINKDVDFKKISRIRVSGNEKLDNDLEDWLKYFDENPNEKYVSDGDPNTFVINKEEKINVKEGIKIKEK